MAFKKLARVKPNVGPVSITFHRDGESSTLMKLSLAAHRAIGEPVAVHFEWDDEGYRLRIVASNPKDPAAYNVRTQRRVGVTGLPEMLRIDAPTGIAIDATVDGPLALIADLSEYRSN